METLQSHLLELKAFYFIKMPSDPVSSVLSGLSVDVLDGILG